MNRKKHVRNSNAVNNNRIRSLGILLIMLVFVGSIALSFTLKATASESHEKYKYFKSVQIQTGDTLWSIADEYVSEEYASKEAYIKEVKEMNALTSNEIHSGNYLVIPYYDEEQK